MGANYDSIQYPVDDLEVSIYVGNDTSNRFYLYS